MLTARGYRFLLLDLAGALGAEALGQEDVTILLLTLAVWFGFEWFLFALRLRTVVPRLTLSRLIEERPAQSQTLWADRPVRMAVRIGCPSWLGLPAVRVAERPPAVGVIEGSTTVWTELTNDHPVHLEYTYRCEVPGLVRFEGVRLDLADRQGFFHAHRFLRKPVRIAILPPLGTMRTVASSVKRFNVLPTHGHHRHLRPGSSSELLELRDYQPGDPPKSIAWKVSARRGKLMTKEYESEVPVRCTIFLDISDSVRVGPPGKTALSHSMRLVGAMAQRLLAARDPVGVCLFDERHGSLIPPAPGNRQLLRIQARLARVARAPMAPSECLPEDVLGPAIDLCQEVYPELLRPAINRAEPWYRRMQFFSLRSIVALLVLPVLAGILFGAYGGGGPLRLQRTVLALLLVAVISFIWYLSYKFTGPRPPRRQIKPLAAVLAARYGLGAAGLARLQRDGYELTMVAQRFLIEHDVAYHRPLFGYDGRYLFNSPRKLSVLAQYLLRAVLHGRDNELFVVVVDLLELPEEWDPLIRAVRVAVARHHQVVVLCTWPAELASPLFTRSPDAGTDTAPVAASSMARQLGVHQVTREELELSLEARAKRMLRRLDEARFGQSYERLKHELGRIRVPVLAAIVGDPVAYVVERVERLRAARTAPRG